MKQKIFSLFLILGILSKAYACINGDTQILKNGSVISVDQEGHIVPYGHEFFEGHYTDILIELDSLWKATKDIAYLSDYGVILILQKRYEEAKSIYLQIEKIKPNRYSTSSNLGTIYELEGENKKAHFWIKKAIDIDSSSHYNSEWLHLKILEAKINGENSITSDFFLGTNFGQLEIPYTNLSKEKLLRLREALYFQLNERVSFIKPKDKIIAALLFDLGNIAYLTDAKNEALIIYAKSKEYGFNDSILEIRQVSLTKNISTKASVMQSSKSKRMNYILWISVALIGVSLLIAAVVLSKRKKNYS